jgi:hypothetical protein
MRAAELEGEESMRHFTDTSFLCAFYRLQEHSERSFAFMDTFKGEITVSSQVFWEFRQPARFQVFLHQIEKSKAERMIEGMASNVKIGVLALATVEWPDVHSFAETLSATYTMKDAHRSMMDIQLATSQHLGVKFFSHSTQIRIISLRRRD